MSDLAGHRLPPASSALRLAPQPSAGGTATTPVAESVSARGWWASNT
jgi:hypothetical protein